METLIPLRALALDSGLTGDPTSTKAARNAAEVFLRRNLFRIKPRRRWWREVFTTIHYPCYWHYDILFALKVMAEAGFIADPRCNPALDVLESKRLPDGGFPAEAKYYSVSRTAAGGRSLVDWGGTSIRRMNPFVTADALFVLKSARRLRLA
jgi:hypothetical protein